MFTRNRTVHYRNEPSASPNNRDFTTACQVRITGMQGAHRPTIKAVHERN